MIRQTYCNSVLRKCPCCGAPADVVITADDNIIITCSKNGCRMVTGDKPAEVVKIWNEKYFTECPT